MMTEIWYVVRIDGKLHILTDIDELENAPNIAVLGSFKDKHVAEEYLDHQEQYSQCGNGPFPR